MSSSKLHHTRAAPSVFIDYDIIKEIKGELKIIKLIFERTARWYGDNFIFMDDKVNPCGTVVLSFQAIRNGKGTISEETSYCLNYAEISGPRKIWPSLWRDTCGLWGP